MAEPEVMYQYTRKEILSAEISACGRVLKMYDNYSLAFLLPIQLRDRMSQKK